MANPQDEPIQLEVADGVATATIDNPPVNLLDRYLFRALRSLIDRVEADPEARVLVLRSANPDFFIAHYDVELILATPVDGEPERPDQPHAFHQLCERYRTSPMPTICEIGGRVGGGGGELSASCDMRFGELGRTVLCQMEVPLGILPGGSGTQRLPQLVGRGRALEIILGGDDIDASTLERWGWLNRALPPGELRPWVDAFARRLAGFDPDSLALAKASTLASFPDETDGLIEEAHLFDQSLRLPAARRRMRNFLDRGGQTPAVEGRIGAAGAELDSPPTAETGAGAGDPVARWLALDPDPDTVAELEGLIGEDPAQVSTLFDGRIAFGTAGLRAALGPGPKRMNRLVVRQTTEGLMRWLGDGATVIIGYDARYKSEEFAHDAARVVVAAGGRAEVLPEPIPTPVLAHAVIDRGCDAGIMITASHNPATDNGYKLYLGDGIQLVSPADAEIAALIDEVAAEQSASGASALDIDGAVFDVLDDEPADRHRRSAIETLKGLEKTDTPNREVSIVYTAMHGVGGAHLVDCFAEAGFSPPIVVAEQFEPDPDFPTAAFPNPEEPGALDLATALTRSQPDEPDLILANDPDADRLAVAIRVPPVDGGSADWQRLSGDQVGALLLDYILEKTTGETTEAAGSYVVASSIVSSQLINAMAAAASERDGVVVDSVRTLTGFKWVARPIVEQEDTTYLFGYEEALGYCVGDSVRDKDGISAALVMAALAADCRARGATLWDRLEAIMTRHGLYATDQVTIGFAGMSEAEADTIKAKAMAIRPTELAGVPIERTEDLSAGENLPATPGLVLERSDGARVLIRPSGTEPKLKVYLEVIVGVGDGPDGVSQARKNAQLQLDELAKSVRDAIG